MLFEEKKKISEVSEFSTLPYTRNRKLRNLRKCSFTLNFDSCCNLRFGTDKNELRPKLKVIKWIKKKKRKLLRFSTFWFCPISKIENLEILESEILLQILTTFFKFVFYTEREKPCFFVTFDFKSHLSRKLH